MPRTVVGWRAVAGGAVRGGRWAGTGCRCRPAEAAACIAARPTAAQSHWWPAAVTTSTTTGGVRPAYNGVRLA